MVLYFFIVRFRYDGMTLTLVAHTPLSNSTPLSPEWQAQISKNEIEDVNDYKSVILKIRDIIKREGLSASGKGGNVCRIYLRLGFIERGFYRYVLMLICIVGNNFYLYSWHGPSF